MIFSQTVSDLNAAATNLDVIGNNIANSAIYGFKSDMASFTDMFAGSEAGLGTKVTGTTQGFTDGITTNAGHGLDVIINQNGFFRVADSNGSVFYNRNGQFKLDENHNIVNMQGLRPTGYPTTGMPSTAQRGANPAPITIPNTLTAAKFATTASMQVNLNSTDEVLTKTPFNPSDADSYNKKGNVTIFDSQGNAHDMNIPYVKNEEGSTWKIFTQDASAGDAGEPTRFMRFDNSGLFLGINATAAEAPPTVPAVWPKDTRITTGPINGAVPANSPLGFLDSMQQNTGANNIVATDQNGYKPGDLVSCRINNDDMVVGDYSNKQQQVLGQIVLTNSTNNEGLAFQGGNVQVVTQSSGVTLLGTAGEDNFGKLTNGALEVSNVDLSKELVNMVVAQRNYQLNIQAIKIQDQILNTLVSLC